jgi:hypothetical protein
VEELAKRIPTQLLSRFLSNRNHIDDEDRTVKNQLIEKRFEMGGFVTFSTKEFPKLVK